tara:strand:+ start:4071 stop:4547 length:477 start_codon:yes stop_codon:yes gene_type:complete
MKFFFILFFLFFSCEDEKIAHVEVTMLRVPYVPLSVTEWETPIYIYGQLNSNNYDVEGMIVNWYTDTYWDVSDSTSYYRLLCGDCDYGVRYDLDGTTDTSLVNIYNLKWITDRSSVVDSLGYFYNVLRPVYPMRNSFMTLWWSIEGTVIDSQEIFLMD